MTVQLDQRIAARPARRPRLIGLGKLSGSEFRLLCREPGMAWVVVLPILLCAVFGLLPATGRPSPDFGGGRMIDFYVPVLVSFVVALMALNTLAAVLGTYRERGVLRRLAVTPVKPLTLLVAQGLVNLAVLAGVIVGMLALAGFAFDVPMPKQVVGYLLALLVTIASMFSIGLLVAALAPTGKAANGIGTVLMFPSVFLAGLWTPGPAMGDVVRRIAEFTPLGAGGQAMQEAWSGSFPSLLHLVVPVVYTLVIGFIAARTFRWE
ncbi:ABC transporter permease [Actinocrispum wychmicini]|uniref:Transport permease protein n=1 Tax=Actinocrispum wychmicini TaxID=1213861 RepID=A0A4R2JQQ9_9PSEU|nr:ABC transporter permease [Actinocrispum wychmicini]TCO62571.1 ABC-2 type transport system permease protein [Actinocrispum wychmicini]